jgi:hypothetical protein
VSKVVLGIVTGILIFIAAGILATYWVGKMRREMEQKRPQVAVTLCLEFGDALAFEVS